MSEHNVLQEIPGGSLDNKKTFLNHLLNFNPEGKAEFLNVLQYGVL